jgi:hypothetical protein
MKSIVSFQLLDNPFITVKPDIGFVKLYFKNNILTSKNSSGIEKNLVLDTLLTGLSISPVSTPIVATDSIIEAFGKLQASINAGGGTNIRRSETFYAPSYISYLAFAPDGSLETDAVWTITKRVGSADGAIVSNIQYFNKKWTERGLL